MERPESATNMPEAGEGYRRRDIALLHCALERRSSEHTVCSFPVGSNRSNSTEGLPLEDCGKA